MNTPIHNVQERGRSRTRSRSPEQCESEEEPYHSRCTDYHTERQRSAADKIVIEAEKFKASVAPQRGKDKLDYSHDDLLKLRKDDDDDDFFHVTCHLDAQLKERIEMGEFIELELLLPKERCGGSHVYREDRDMKLVLKDGQTFCRPVQELRINNVRKWEQAFRLYAAVYTQANPGRAGEIWQYIHCINTAALSFPWDNVAYYDFTFRQLMAAKPWRSWSKTYTQGWNLALRGNNNFSHSGGTTGHT